MASVTTFANIYFVSFVTKKENPIQYGVVLSPLSYTHLINHRMLFALHKRKLFTDIDALISDTKSGSITCSS